MADSQILTQKQNLYMAKLAHESERYNDMMNYMKNLACTEVSPSSDLTLEERRLLFLACTKVIGSLRSAWRSVASVEEKELVEQYRVSIEAEISKFCDGILELLDKSLIPSASSSESQVFYLTKKGDYERYSAEIKDGDDFNLASEKAMESYNAAERTALAGIRPSHPVRLGLAINLSVFYYDVLESSQAALSTASLALRDALADINSLPEELYQESTHMMQQLQDNLDLWKEP
ncbi:unnamed protein product [Coffea canephora]|uniref:14-3-3 domain-containing protein n=1 Tax=Coffea canephora TaxID=49390 RepID=A0A068TZ15_COFCA|nr:unnamed protein product [Coffea canephora]